MEFIRRFLWVPAALLGVIFIASGAYMISEGFAAKDEVRTRLRAEQVTTSKDAAIPGVLVEDVATAQAQEEVLTEHTLGRLGPYSSMERSDPNRDTYLKGVTLRNALNLAVVGFKVSDLVAGVGAIVLLVGLTNVLLVAPMLYWLKGAEQR